MPVTHSPLRYPGGKTSLSSFLSQVIRLNGLDGGIYAEPYAGGAGAGLSLLFSGVVDRLILNDADMSIYSFWWAVLNRPDDLLRLIQDTPVTIEEWTRQKTIFNYSHGCCLERGFATFFLNRCNRSGILLANPIGGLNQTGKWNITSRYNKAALKKKIQSIAELANKITVMNHDAVDFLRIIDNVQNVNLFVYLDPPYYSFGQGLYMNAYQEEDHSVLAEFMQTQTRFQWLMTYDDNVKIRKIYTMCRVAEFNLNYSAHRPRKGCELLIHPVGLAVPTLAVTPYYGVTRTSQQLEQKNQVQA